MNKECTIVYVQKDDEYELCIEVHKHNNRFRLVQRSAFICIILITIRKMDLEKVEKHLSIRSFLDRDKRTVYEQPGGICPICKNHFEFSEMAGDHIVPWSKGGKSVLENLQMLCTDCNLKKSDN